MNTILKGSVVLVVLFGLLMFVAPMNSTGAELAKDQVFVVGSVTGDIGTLDPQGGILTQDRSPQHHLYGALVRYPIGNADSPEFQPDLATKWEVSPDKLTWTFHLRKGVKWHWGYGEVTAEDVLYTLNRLKNSKVSSYRGDYANFKEVKAVDKYTVQITTAKPSPFLLNRVANYLGGRIICKNAVEKAGAFDKALSPVKEEIIGTGPFKLLEYKPKDRIILVRNDDYWEGKPIIERIIYRYIPDEGVREVAIKKGELSVTQGIYEDKWIKYMRSQGIVVDAPGATDLKALHFNLKVKPFDDKRVREAIAYGTGQDDVIAQQGKEISGYCTSPVPAGVYGHIDAGWGKYKRDPEKAKKLLAEAGYSNGLTVKMLMSVGSWYLDKMVIFQNSLKEIGVNLEMTQVDHTVYRTRIPQGANPIAIWGATYPLATQWLRNFYHTESMIGTPTATLNFMYYSNPEVDKAIELAETTFDEKIQLEALSKAQKLIVQDLPSIPVLETHVPIVRNPWVDLGYEIKSNFIYMYEVGLKTKILKH